MVISAMGEKSSKEGGYVFREGQFSLSHREVRESLRRKHLSTDLTGWGLSCTDIWEKSFPGRGNSQCKDPERAQPGVTQE